MTLEFPFVKVDKLASAFGQIPNMQEAIKACPPEFHDYRNPWCKVAEHIFFYWTDFDFEIAAESQAEANDKLRYLGCWLRSFDPKHEHKIAVAGWLLSLMLSELPEAGAL